jgi:hypothetical protein
MNILLFIPRLPKNVAADFVKERCAAVSRLGDVALSGCRDVTVKSNGLARAIQAAAPWSYLYGRKVYSHCKL